MAEATVQVQIEDGVPVGPVLSDADGAFSVGNLDPSDRLFLSASKDDLRSERFGPLVLPAEGLSDVRITLESTGSISGRVVDEAGEPVPGAAVGAALSMNEGRGTFERTDEAGRFRLQRLLRGHYVLRLVRPGAGLGSTVSCGDVQLNPGEHVTDLVLVLKRPEGLTIAGRVTDHSGKPVEDATVDAMRPSMIETTKTDAQGFYTVIGLDDVFYNVVASHKQFGRQLRDSVPAGSMGVDLVLPGVCDIAGTVVDAATGAAVTEFEVALDYYAAAGVDPRSHRGYRTVQNPEGRFAFEGVDVGQPTLVVRAPSYAPHMQALKPIGPGETVSDIIVRLKAGRSVDGIVVDAIGRPLRGVAIFVGQLPAESARESSVAARSDADGTFHIAGLMAEENTLTAYSPQSSPVTVGLSPATTQRVRIVLGGGGTVEGHVTRGGAPIAGARLTLTPAGAARSDELVTRSGADGGFRLAGVPPGEARVVATLASPNPPTVQGRSQSQVALVEQDRTTKVHFEFAPDNAVLEGRVTYNGQATEAGLSVVALDANGATEKFSSGTDSAGNYRFERVPAGELTLTVRRITQTVREDSPYPARSFSVTTEEGRTTRFDVELSGGAILNGSVSNLRPNDGGTVMMLEGRVQSPEMTPNLNSLVVGRAGMETSGAFRLEGVLPGTYTLYVRVFQRPQQGESIDPATERYGLTVVEVTEAAEQSVEVAVN